MKTAVALLLLSGMIVRPQAGATTQQNSGSANQAGATLTSPPLPSSAPALETKIVDGGFVVRLAGSKVWKKSSEIQEPIVVGHLEGDQNIYLPTKAVKPPKAQRSGSPIVPENERRSHIPLRLTLHVVVDEKGKVDSATVDESPSPELATVARNAVQEWVFKPATLKDQAVATLMVIQIVIQPTER